MSPTKTLALAGLALIYIAFLISGLAFALDSESGIISNPNSTMYASSGTISSPNSATYAASGNGSSGAQGYSSFARAGLTFANGDCQSPRRGFWKGLSYSGPCDALPKGSICLTYSDGYTWVVNDYRIDCAPIFAGVSNCMPIEVFRCYGANYYHILGTQFIMSVPKMENTVLVPLPECMPV